MKWTVAAISLILALTLLDAASVSAQEPTPRPSPQAAASPDCPKKPVSPVSSIPPIPPLPPIPPVPPIGLGKVLYPVNFIMQNARALGLSEEQRSFMQDEIQATTKKYNELQWQLNDSMEVLVDAVKADATAEQEALNLLEKVLTLEGEIKRIHLTMGIRIKNKLSPEQRKKLEALRTSRAQSARPG